MKIVKRIKIFLVLLIIIYGTFLALLWAFQEDFIFYPHTTTDEKWTEAIERLGGDYVSIRADDGAILEGIFLSNKSNLQDETPKPTVIVFGGNATLVEDIIDEFTKLSINGISVLLMDYRGYGLSTGKPDIELMKHDAEKIFDAVSSHPLVDSKHISVFGISLGTGIATHLASTRPVDKVILMSPMTSTVDIGFKMFPIVPKQIIRLLLRHKIENLKLASELMQPALIIHGENDKKISIKQGKKIANAWIGKATFVSIKNGIHDNLLEDETVWRQILAFLQK